MFCVQNEYGAISDTELLVWSGDDDTVATWTYEGRV